MPAATVIRKPGRTRSVLICDGPSVVYNEGIHTVARQIIPNIKSTIIARKRLMSGAKRTKDVSGS